MDDAALSSSLPQDLRRGMAELSWDYLHYWEFPTVKFRGIGHYILFEQIGRGTYGQVYRARNRKTGELVALKKIKLDLAGMVAVGNKREIKILEMLHHENIIRMKEVALCPGPKNDEPGILGVVVTVSTIGTFMLLLSIYSPVFGCTEDGPHRGNIYLVLEYMDHDLDRLARSEVEFTTPLIKRYMKQLLAAVSFCHANEVMHRDIRGANILVNKNGCLKLADFTLSRSFGGDEDEQFSNEVVALWYRAPELLLGERKYGPAVDIWSVGCVFGELLKGRRGEPIFRDATRVNYYSSSQFRSICEVCGTPDEVTWPGSSRLPKYEDYMPQTPLKRQVREHFQEIDSQALELLEMMLTLNPAQRITARDALEVDYFKAEPPEAVPLPLPIPD